jgi:hypothetical protein
MSAIAEERLGMRRRSRAGGMPADLRPSSCTAQTACSWAPAAALAVPSPTAPVAGLTATHARTPPTLPGCAAIPKRRSTSARGWRWACLIPVPAATRVPTTLIKPSVNVVGTRPNHDPRRPRTTRRTRTDELRRCATGNADHGRQRHPRRTANVRRSAHRTRNPASRSSAPDRTGYRQRSPELTQSAARRPS